VTPCPVVAEQSADQLGPDAAVWSSSVSRVGAKSTRLNYRCATAAALGLGLFGGGLATASYLPRRYHRCAARRTLAEYAGRILPPDRSCEVSAGIGIRDPRRRPECCGSPYGPSTSNWVSADRASHPTPQQSSCEHLGLVAQDAQLVIGVKAKALRLLSVSAPRLELLDRRARPSR